MTNLFSHTDSSEKSVINNDTFWEKMFCSCSQKHFWIPSFLIRGSSTTTTKNKLVSCGRIKQKKFFKERSKYLIFEIRLAYTFLVITFCANIKKFKDKSTYHLLISVFCMENFFEFIAKNKHWRTRKTKK